MSWSWSSRRQCKRIRHIPATHQAAHAHEAVAVDQDMVAELGNELSSLVAGATAAPQQVLEWLASADGGRFSDVVVPPGIDGRGLLGMNARRLTQMAESGHAAGRNVGELPEDAAWYLSMQAKVGTAIFHALRDAQRMEGQGRGVARACA